MFVLESLFHTGKAEHTTVNVVAPRDAGAVVQQKLAGKLAQQGAPRKRGSR